MLISDEPARPGPRDTDGPRTAFVTGATGCVGSFLTALLLRQGCRVIALVRGPHADERMQAALARSGACAPADADRLRVIVGDVCLPHLGLDEARIADLGGRVDEVWHCAATFQFRPEHQAAALAVNVEGTRRTLELAALWAARRPVALHYVSTAFAAPAAGGVGVEALPAGMTAARNGYEDSKQRAERLVVELARERRLPATIYRPAIILGHSQTGQAVRYAAYYDMLRALQVVTELRRREEGRAAGVNLGLRVRARGDLRLNVVPVDFVVEAMSRLAAVAPGDGGIFHVVHETPVSVGALFDCACATLGISGVELVGEASFQARAPTRLERLFERMTRFEAGYLQTEAVFDRARFRAAIPVEALPAPLISRAYLERINRVFLAEAGQPNPAARGGEVRGAGPNGGRPAGERPA